MKGAVAAVDLGRLPGLVRDREVGGVNRRQAPLPELDEAISPRPEVRIADSIGHLRNVLAGPRSGAPARNPTGPVCAGPGVQGAITTVDLHGLPIYMRHQEVVSVGIPKTELAQLKEPSYSRV